MADRPVGPGGPMTWVRAVLPATVVLVVLGWLVPAVLSPTVTARPSR